MSRVIAALPLLAFSIVAQRPDSGEAAPAAQPASRSSSPAQSDANDDMVTTVSAVTVKMNQKPVGSVIGDIAPEQSFSAADIQSFGVASVTELLAELAPEVRSDRGRGGAPVVLLNGRRISGFNEVQNIPSEAILRVDILPEEVSLKYGYSADQKVVNIVLRRRFRAITGELQGGAATEGGTVTGKAEGDLLHLRGDDRLNLDLQYSAKSPLTEADRDVMEPPSTALNANAVDLAKARSLTPATQTATLNAVQSRSSLGGIALTLNGTLSATRSDSRQGLGQYGLAAPSTDPFYQPDIGGMVSLYEPGDRLVQSTQSWSGHLGGTLNKDVGPWRHSLTAGYDHSDGRTHSPGGLDASLAQGAATALDPTFNPYAPAPAALVVSRASALSAAVADSGNVQWLSTGPLAKLPAGDLFVSAKLGASTSGLASHSDRPAPSSVWISRSDLNSQVNLDAPITSVKAKRLSFLGDLTVNLNVAIDQWSDVGSLWTTGAGFNWSPVQGYSLLVSTTDDHLPPTPQQLASPVVITPGVRVFDFVSGQTADVAQISGGATNLVPDHRRVWKVGLSAKPIPSQNLTISANYIATLIRDPIVSSLPATQAVETALPTRYVRNATGQLVSVDARPFNIDQQWREELRWGFNWSIPLPGSAPPSSAPLQRADRSDDRRGSRDGSADGARRGSGGFGGFGGGAQQGRLQFAIYHTVVFRDGERLTAAGPKLDFLNGASPGGSGGQPQQEVEAQFGYMRNGLGARLSADWKSATRVSGDPLSSTGDLRFSALSTVNLRLWANLGARPEIVRAYPVLRGVRVTVSVTNLFDERQSVTSAMGAPPISYQGAYLDPTGRVAMLSVRKLFF